MLRDSVIFRFSVGSSLCLLLMSLPARGQGSAPDSTSSLAGSLQALAAEVEKLNATIQELRTEVSQSREETRELRAELERRLATSPPANAPVGAAGVPNVQAGVTNGQELASASSKTAAEARLARLEEDQQLLQAKVDEQHQTKVESESKYRVKLSGLALVNLFGNRGTVDNQDIPNVALPQGNIQTSGSVGATVRQSEIGLAVFGPTVAGARASASVNFDFVGGFADAPNGVTDTLVRMRTAVFRMDWSRTSLVGGQDAPFFSPLSPTSFAALGYPAFSDAGNLWTWTPQLRVEHRLSLSESNRLLLQAGILDPLSGEAPYSEYYRTPTAGEQSRKPAAGSRISWAHRAGNHALTLGIGGYYSRQNYGAGRTTDAWAGTADWDIPLGGRFGLSGEFYRGRALGGLGAAEDRSVIFDGPPSDPTSDFTPLNTVGGWAQLKFKATEAIEFNAAYGQDNPFSRDLHYFLAPVATGYDSVGKNQSAMVNAIFRPRSDLLFALEYRFLDTRQTTSAINTAGTINLSMGLLF